MPIFTRSTGIGYTLCRTHINSCDFSLGNYAYAETEGDFELEHFSIERDRKWLIPMIRAAAEPDRCPGPCACWPLPGVRRRG